VSREALIGWAAVVVVFVVWFAWMIKNGGNGDK
jgi:hypothetical protein